MATGKEMSTAIATDTTTTPTKSDDDDSDDDDDGDNDGDDDDRHHCDHHSHGLAPASVETVRFQRRNMALSTNADDRRRKGTCAARCLRRTCHGLVSIRAGTFSAIAGRLMGFILGYTLGSWEADGGLLGKLL